ncbi:molybdopterin-guanine dinucleotide biosynthesis protein B [Mesorhizobium sp. CAU 1732]|uniref:molybdopterin-guanine dinucleotide biosynthesis protein B n=1 Tax=Mesorhizobium sp. CAU 1732 TaxID=3140358 RepID=UPI003261B894
MDKIIGIAGWKNAGKTTLTESLVTELTSRGWTVSTVKHAHHDADVDAAGTDTHRHRTAGASEVMLVTGRRWALMHELRDEEEPPLDQILARLSPCDIVLVEGYKTGPHRKIEVRRTAAQNQAPLPETANVVAIASDSPVHMAPVPVFALDDVTAIADFVEVAVGLRNR